MKNSVRTPLQIGLLSSLLFGLTISFILTIKSVIDFSRPGPPIQEEVFNTFATYAVYAIARLSFWTLVLSSLLAGIGILVYGALTQIFKWRFGWTWSLAAAACGFGILILVQFCQHLLFLPSSIAASFNYRLDHLYPLWEQLTPERLALIQWLLLVVVTLPIIACALSLYHRNNKAQAIAWICTLLFFAGIFTWATLEIEPTPVVATQTTNKPNIIMIGSDTLRADRLGLADYPRDLTPFIDKLSKQGVYFTNAYVPIARTAPSLTTLMTGNWPHTHGIIDNFIPDDETKLPVPGLPALLNKAGYHTLAIGDWAASDLGKINFGFEETQVPPDQWNLKYLIRQGPKDIRLFLSLFTHNRFGQTFLPELYYLAGIPLTEEMTRAAKRTLNKVGTTNQPFFLNLFIASTHGPFGSNYPYYTLFSDRNYRGPSKFVISGLTDAESIAKRQAQGASSFDVQQIIDLYDGATRQFDDAVAKVITHLRAQGLDKNTIIVIYSDHGADLFEQGTWGQGNTVLGRDPSARIPLLIIDPSREKSHTVNKTVRSVDLAPTLLTLLNLPIPKSMEGVSLLPYLEDPEADLGLYSYTETGSWLGNIPGMAEKHLRYPPLLNMLYVPDVSTGTLAIEPKFIPQIIKAKDRMVRNDQWKLISLPLVDGDVYWLFNVSTDPDCTENVISQYPNIANDLKNALATRLFNGNSHSVNSIAH